MTIKAIIASVFTTLFLFTSSFSFADETVTDAQLQQFHDAEVAQVQSQIDSLYEAIALLQMGSITTEEYFELIGKASFESLETSLAGFGFTVQSFYEFKDIYQQEIQSWLETRPEQQSLLSSLEYELSTLTETFDQLNQSAEIVE